MTLLDEVKKLATTIIKGYTNFLNVDTFMYWIIDSITDFILDIHTMINNIYPDDIIRCFESIFILGNDALYDAMEFITDLGMTNLRRKHPRFKQLF